jgi:hypothetical protein
MGAETTKSSLYDRLGGIYAIATVVDDFIDRIMIDPALNANPLVDEAHHRVGKAGFKYLVTEMVGGATGGTSEIYWPVDARLARGPQDNRRGMGRLLQGLPKHARQVQGPRSGAAGDLRYRSQHQSRHRQHRRLSPVRCCCVQS